MRKKVSFSLKVIKVSLSSALVFILPSFSIADPIPSACPPDSTSSPMSPRENTELQSLLNHLRDASQRTNHRIPWVCHYENPYIPLQEVGRNLGWNPTSITNNRCTLSRLQSVELSRGRFFDGNTPSFQSDFACNATQEVVDRDSHRSCRPSPALLRRPFPPMAPRRIEGSLNFLGALPFPFSYDVETLPDGRLKVKARVRFTRNGRMDAVPSAEAQSMREMMRQASLAWSRSSPNQDIVYDFDIAQDTATEPNLTVNLETGWTRGPYFSNWSSSWSSATIAHELGHLMGLDDEYHQMRNTASGTGFVANLCYELWGSSTDQLTRDRCDPVSLMCNGNDSRATPQPYHHYLIARRIACADKPVNESCIPPHLEDRINAPI
jgi:hypothetical protein